jgi:serine/threonine protein kinase
LSSRDDLLNEARTMAALEGHDNVVRVFDAGDWDDDFIYIASQPCLEGSLESLCDGGYCLDPATACRLISDACRGLEYMHQQGLLHLDIRPANILLSGSTPKIADFGLARWTGNADVPEVYAPHAAPEMLASYDGTKASDQYAMAMTLAHLLSAGAACNMPPDPHDVKAWRKWAPLQILDLNVPIKLKRVLDRATEYDPVGRYASVEDFKRAVDGATPAVSFRMVDQTHMQSKDGEWSITWSTNRRGWSVDTRYNGRRDKTKGATNVDESSATRHIVGLITTFASA